MPLDTEPIIIKVPAQVSIPSGSPSAPDWTALVGRVAAIEGLGVVDLSDVDVSGLADGLSLVWDAATETWKPGSSGGTIERAGTYEPTAGTWITSGDDIYQFRAVRGAQITFGVDPAVAYIEPVYGTSAQSVAAGNHTHSIRAGVPFSFPASGSLSSGTRTLVSGTVTGLDPAKTYILWGTLKAQLRGEGAGAGYSLPRIVINANTVADVEPVRTVSGVPHTTYMEHEGVSVTGVSTVNVSATLAYSEGDPIYVGAGKLVIRVESNR